MWKAAALALAGCSAGAAPVRTLSNTAAHAGAGAQFTIDDDSMGPLTAATPATQEGVQAAIGARYTVKIVDDHGPEVHVFLGDELLFYVIPNDDHTLFNVHCTSNRIAISQHPEWVIGAALRNAAPLTQCECWGAHPMCFRAGDHVAVGFAVPCDGLDTPAQRAHLEGIPIQRAVWSPRKFGGGDPPAPTPQKSLLVP